MKLFRSNAEARLLDTMKILRDNSGYWHAQLFNFSALSGIGIVEDFTDILVGYIIEQFADREGYCFVCADGDVLLLCPTALKKNLDSIAKNFSAHMPEEAHRKMSQPLMVVFDLAENWSRIVKMAHNKLETYDMNKKIAAVKTKAPAINAIIVKENQQRLLAKGIDERKVREKPSVLLVEDDPLSLHLAKRALEKNFTITTASNASEARASYISNVPDVVFLDIGLPDTSGHALLGELLAIDQEAFVVMLSGNSFPADIVKAMKTGAKGFVGKPFSRAKLLQYVAQSPHCAGSEAISNLH